MSKKNKKKNKRRLNKKRFLGLIIILIIIVAIINIFNSNITNIYISGNKYLSDQEIIDIAKLTNYPNIINNLSFNIEKRLQKNKYIYKSEVRRNILLNKVYIKVEENYPLFYYNTEKKTVLCNGEKVDDNLTSLVVNNSIPSKIYDEFISKLKKIDINILNRISEIKYSPNEVLEERFFLLMNDGNYVYITLNKFLTLNKYLDIIKSFNNKKGILYLDSGEYFDVFDK